MDEDELSWQNHQQYEGFSTNSRDASPSSFSSLVAAFVTKKDITEPVGMELDIANGHTIITEIAHDSLAYHTDLRPGMIIHSINHVECHGKTIPQVRHLLATAIPTVAILAQARRVAASAAPVSETMMKCDDFNNDDISYYSDERPPPPGLPSGGYWIVKHYAGVTTMVAFFVGCFCFYGLGPIALCCPCDERIEYVVDGNAYNAEVRFFVL